MHGQAYAGRFLLGLIGTLGGWYTSANYEISGAHRFSACPRIPAPPGIIIRGVFLVRRSPQARLVEVWSNTRLLFEHEAV